MAKPESNSRSDAIREYLSSNPKAGPKEVVEALKAKGIEVKVGLVSNVKHRMQPGSRKSRRHGAGKRRAKQQAMTGTEAIRAYLKDHPKAGPNAIKSALAEQGVKISASLASAVKYRKRSRRTPALSQSARRTRSANSAVTVDRLLELKRFADSIGGVEQVRAGLETLSQFS